MKKAPTVITGTVGMDAHVIGTKVLSRALRDAGFKVVELGMQVTPEEFISVAQETKADAILMSSLYGMAELDLKDFNQKRMEAGLGDIVLIRETKPISKEKRWILAGVVTRAGRTAEKTETV